MIMRPFLENVKASVSRRPRKITFIYLNPVYKDLMTEKGFKLEKEIHMFGPNKCFVYSYEIA